MTTGFHLDNNDMHQTPFCQHCGAFLAERLAERLAKRSNQLVF